MILIDTNVFVALVDPIDALRPAAAADMARLLGRPMFTTPSVLTETTALLRRPAYRDKLVHLLDELGVAAAPDGEDPAATWGDVFSWLSRYAEHVPDWTDAHLAVLCGRERRYRVWSYDREFLHIWRRPDGSRIPLAARIG